MHKHILSIDGGGLKGAFAASFLANIESLTGKNIASCFDLIGGTSTGGIVAVGLGLGIPASEIVSIYKKSGPIIFSSYGFQSKLKQIFRPKYNAKKLQDAINSTFGERQLGESTTRLLIPAYNGTTNSVHIFKTSHHPRFELDFRERAADVCLATAAAPTYFPTHKIKKIGGLIDGGIWANNPVSFLVVEGLSTLNWSPSELKVLSIGTADAGPKYKSGFGAVTGLRSLISLFMSGQSAGSNGVAKLLIQEETSVEKRLFRITGGTEASNYEMDDPGIVDDLIAYGDSEARHFIEKYRQVFLHEPREPFEPFHSVFRAVS